MNPIIFRIKIVLGCLVIGILSGVCMVGLGYLLSLDLNLKQCWVAFGGFSLFGLVAGVISAITIKLPQN
jgi:hypothetical protein